MVVAGNANLQRILTGVCPYDTNITDDFNPAAYSITAYSTGFPPGLGVKIGVPLPIEFVKFTGEAAAKNTNLSWTTSQEINNAYFEVQYSLDRYTFNTLEKIAGAENSDVEIDYHYTHKAPISGMNYYRLQQFDFDGQSSYSSVVSVLVGKQDNFFVYPNPVKDVLNLSFQDDLAADATAQIIRQDGQIIYTVNLVAESSVKTLNTSELATGVYTIRILNGSEIYTQRFVKN